MTALLPDPRTHDCRLPLTATGLLREFADATVLSAADVHVARTLGELGGEDDQRVLLAAALATRAVRHGSVCLDLSRVTDLALAEDPGGPGAAAVPEPAAGPEPRAGIVAGLTWPAPDEWREAIAASPLVAQGALHLEFGLLYLDRYHRQELLVQRELEARRARSAPPVDATALVAGAERVFPGESYAEQRAVAVAAVRRLTTVLAGGPGTGKTTTVAGLLALVVEQAELAGARPRIALAAPTGKAAARLQEAVTAAAQELPAPDRDRLDRFPASTLHRLLGSRPDHHTRFRHHRGNRLPYDLVVVDETSMVSLTMMARLLEALRADARLVLVGDPDQLASVDAGAVLSDLVAGFASSADSPVVRLSTVHRFGPGIAHLADAIRAGSADDALDVLRSGVAGVEFVETDDPAPHLHEVCLAAAIAVRDRALAGDEAGALQALHRHRLLCAHREGPFGVRQWNRRVEAWLTEETGEPLYEPMYVGRPLLVNANDYRLGLYNGDTGVVVRHGDTRRAVMAGAGELLDFAPGRLGDVDTMHAMTIHKSQGSQVQDVTVLVPPTGSRMLTREVLYTAVTRAERSVRVVGTEQAVRAAVERPALRASGLRHRLSGPAGG